MGTLCEPEVLSDCSVGTVLRVSVSCRCSVHARLSEHELCTRIGKGPRLYKEISEIRGPR